MLILKFNRVTTQKVIDNKREFLIKRETVAKTVKCGNTWTQYENKH